MFHIFDNVLAATAHDLSGPPIPGPLVKQMADSSLDGSGLLGNASLSAARTIANFIHDDDKINLKRKMINLLVVEKQQKKVVIITISTYIQRTNNMRLMVPGRLLGQKSLSRRWYIRLPRIGQRLIGLFLLVVAQDSNSNLVSTSLYAQDDGLAPGIGFVDSGRWYREVANAVFAGSIGCRGCCF